ncbi:hypothetical protein Plec18170_001604 [Paecilomyces lecythidis]
MAPLENIEERLRDVQQQVDELVQQAAGNEPLRRRVLETLEDAAGAVRSPEETIWQLVVKPHEYAVLRITLELGIPLLFLNQAERTAAQLAAETAADGMMIVAMKFFEEPRPQTYRSSAITRYLANNERICSTAKFMWDIIGKAVLRLPDYLAKSNYKSPIGKPGAWELAFGEHNFFDTISKDERLMQQFHDMMAVQRFRRPEWFDLFPVEEKIIHGFDPSISDVLLVDIGGSRGHELQKFKRKFPHSPGKLVLEDLPNVIALTSGLEADDIVKIGHNFFSKQPVKDARVYYMRSILHDWDDDKCREILRNIIAAMRKNYSKLLINDWVLPDSGASLYSCLQDINMMTLFSAMERSEIQMAELLESVGLTMVHVWGSPRAERCVEAMLLEPNVDGHN